MTDKWCGMRVVLYETKAPLRPDQKYLAFLVSETPTGANAVSSHSCLLPVRFCAETGQGARGRALAFWNDEIARERQKVERCRLLGERRRQRE